MAKKSRTETPEAVAADAGPSRFKTSVMLAAMLFAPAAFLVMRGNLSVNEALIRFGCALLFAMVGTAVVLSSMPAPGGNGSGDQASRDRVSGDRASGDLPSGIQASGAGDATAPVDPQTMLSTAPA